MSKMKCYVLILKSHFYVLLVQHILEIIYIYSYIVVCFVTGISLYPLFYVRAVL